MSFGLSLIPAMQKEHLSGRFVFSGFGLVTESELREAARHLFRALINEQNY